VETWVGILAAAFGIFGTVGGSVAIVRSAALKESIDLFGKANDELRSEVRHERELRQEGERRCAEEIGAIKGQVEVYRSEALEKFLDDAARRLAAAVRDDLRNNRE
jgi:hypothetical protein